MATGWDYSDLTQNAKESGGPKAYYESIYDQGFADGVEDGKEDGIWGMLPFVALSFVIGVAIGRYRERKYQFKRAKRLDGPEPMCDDNDELYDEILEKDSVSKD